jgi:hypothetical protein
MERRRETNATIHKQTSQNWLETKIHKRARVGGDLAKLKPAPKLV